MFFHKQFPSVTVNDSGLIFKPHYIANSIYVSASQPKYGRCFRRRCIPVSAALRNYQETSSYRRVRKIYGDPIPVRIVEIYVGSYRHFFPNKYRVTSDYLRLASRSDLYDLLLHRQFTANRGCSRSDASHYVHPDNTRRIVDVCFAHLEGSHRSRQIAEGLSKNRTRVPSGLRVRRPLSNCRVSLSLMRKRSRPQSCRSDPCS